MSDRLGLLLHDPARVVYVREGAGPCLLDGWDAVTGLGARLASAQELVLLDPVGFPYEQLTAVHRRIATTVVLPDGVEAPAIDAMLREPLLRHLTPYDRVLGRPEVLAALEERGALGAVEVHVVRHERDLVDALHELWVEERTSTANASFGTIVAHRGDVVSGHVEVFGAHQRSDLAMLLATVRAGETVLDVGAHVGTFAVPLGQAVGSAGRLVAFEPSPASAELLAANLDRNEVGWAEVHHAAVTDRAGDGAVSVPGVPTDTSAATVVRAPATAEVELRTVTLDDWWELAGRPEVHVVKLDVEGYEHRALLGARHMIEAHHPVLLVEVADDRLAARGSSAEDLFAQLEEWGYRFHTNALGSDRRDDRFELETFDPGARVAGLAVDVLCTVEADDGRLRSGGSSSAGEDQDDGGRP